MGLTFVTVTVGNTAHGDRREHVQSLIDSGAIYSLIPETILRGLEIEPHSTREFVLSKVVPRRFWVFARLHTQGR
jgi:hypothetical protein